MMRFFFALAFVLTGSVVITHAETNTSTPTGNVITIDTARPVCLDTACTAPVVWRGWQVLPTGMYNMSPFPGARPAWWQSVLDVLDDLGVNRVSWGVRPGIQNATDWFGPHLTGTPPPTPPPGTGDWLFQYVRGAPFQWSELDLYVDNIFLPLKQRLATHGEPFFWNFEYYNNSRQHGANFTTFRDDPAQFAAWVNAIWTHLDSKYGFVPDSFSLNEPSTTGDHWTMAQVGAAIKAIGDSLAASGWHPRFAGPTSEHVNGQAQVDFDALITQPGVTAYLTDVDYHTYGGYASPSDLQAMVVRAAAHGLSLGMSERIGVDVNGLQDLLANGRISFFRQYNMGGYSAGPQSTGTTNAWLYYVDTSDDNSVHITNPNGYLLRQYFKFIHMNAREVHSESTQSYNMRPIAFVNPNGAPVVVVNVVSVGAGGNVSVAGLPAGRYNTKYSVTGDVDHDLAPQTIGTGQVLSTSIPAVGVITIYRDDTIVPTYTATRISTDNPTVTSTATSTSTPTFTKIATPTTPPSNTPTPPPTKVATSTPPMPTSTSAPTATPSHTPRESPTPTRTSAPTPAPTRIPSSTASSTRAVSPAATATPVQTSTAAPTITSTEATPATPMPTAPPTVAPACIGDCNSSRDVTVDELLSLVDIALGNAPPAECPAGDGNHDGQITVNEILTAVNNALNGC